MHFTCFCTFTNHVFLSARALEFASEIAVVLTEFLVKATAISDGNRKKCSEALIYFIRLCDAVINKLRLVQLIGIA